MDVVRTPVVLLFAGGLCSQFVLLNGVEAVEPVLQVGYPLTVQKALGSSLVVSSVQMRTLVNDINRKGLVLIMVQLDAMSRSLLVFGVALLGYHAI